ncbi:uncharacterized protein BDCG_03180 [Blastomyces dermatitidis ER-3]|uniref:Uncharacterized protein n=1 Tax=Ajellomyces dermatitidis (strain ER-3 / ATCC MYA-2586) TaxID=559297 RepID=A0ABP2EWG6_AJEDR|nr:uncharacterized protein BDCG_03180 [Blastomyces dermatitidis ER-3]EEQ88060.1 hypothetical protein BDCG_03180 [Blastomyces dermatitidis ER-3]
MEKAKHDLRILMAAEEAKENLSESERSLHVAAADRAGSTADRYSSSSYSAAVEEATTIDRKILARLSLSGKATQIHRKRNGEENMYREVLEAIERENQES